MRLNHDYDLENILQLVLIELRNKNIYRSVLDHGPLEINSFSICFWVDIEGVNGVNNLYIKIPKIILYDESKQHINNLSAEDIKLAVDEYESLNYLSKHWDSSLGVHFVKTLGYIKNYNAIITKRIYSEFFFKVYRRYDKYGKSNIHSTNPVQEGMKKFGTSLKLFHSKSTGSVKLNSNTLILKFDKYFVFLEKCNVGKTYLNKLIKLISRYKDLECDSLIVDNFKGIDVRQIFMDQNNDLHIIDPGKITRGYDEVDVARFVVTCRILYWGTLAIIFRIVPSKSYEESFLIGYYGVGGRQSKMLHILIIKEIFKHWKMAHISLEKRNWPKYIKYILRKMYVNPFYKKLMSNELSGLE